MSRPPLILLATLAGLCCVSVDLAVPTVVAAQTADALPTMAPGDYHCETPGPALEALPVAVPSEDFSVLGASTYRAARETGTYLMTGDVAAFTSGPTSGQHLRVYSGAFVRRLAPDGSDTALRCLRQPASHRR